MNKYPSVLEINARTLINKLQEEDPRATLKDVPKSYWKRIKDLGFDYVWLMGVWATSPSSIKEYCFVPELQKEYSQALENWNETDVGGSPYAIDDYVISPMVGKGNQLGILHKQLNKLGLRLILDFVPNHFNAHTSLIKNHAEIFMQGTEADIIRNPTTYYRYKDQIFAHGKDPYFPAWQDTIQVDYSNPQTRQFMIEKIQQISTVCDGIRCDMSMLVMNEIFEKNWLVEMPEQEFWVAAITAIKTQKEDFIFIAEAYWDLEWKLQNFGFDFTYDKKYLDLLSHGSRIQILGHLNADPEFANKSLRFIENHDEDRAITKFGLYRSRAAAMMTYLVPGMRFFFDGQMEGALIKLPVQLLRKPVELYCNCPMKKVLYEVISHDRCTCTTIFYQHLLHIINLDICQLGWWKLMDTKLDQLYGWRWSYKDELLVVIINYSHHQTVYDLQVDKWLNGKAATDLISGSHFAIRDNQINLHFLEYQGIALHCQKSN